MVQMRTLTTISLSFLMLHLNTHGVFASSMSDAIVIDGDDAPTAQVVVDFLPIPPQSDGANSGLNLRLPSAMVSFNKPRPRREEPSQPTISMGISVQPISISPTRIPLDYPRPNGISTNPSRPSNIPQKLLISNFDNVFWESSSGPSRVTPKSSGPSPIHSHLRVNVFNPSAFNSAIPYVPVRSLMGPPGSLVSSPEPSTSLPAPAEVIPKDLEKHWSLIKAEAKLFDDHSELVESMLKAIVRDSVVDYFVAAENYSTISGSCIGALQLRDRSILGYLIAFSCDKIMSDVRFKNDLSKYRINAAIFASSLTKLFMALDVNRFKKLLKAAPFLTHLNINGANIYTFIGKLRASNAPVGDKVSSFIFMMNGATYPVFKLILTEVYGGSIKHVLGLVSSILKSNISRETINYLLNLVKHHFLTTTEGDFTRLSHDQQLSLLSVLLVTADEENLTRLVQAQPGLASSLGNGRLMLYEAVQNNFSVNCIRVLAAADPLAIKQSSNGYLSPLAASIVYDRPGLFPVLFELAEATITERVKFESKDYNPVQLVLLFGRHDVLNYLTSRFGQTVIKTALGLETVAILNDYRVRESISPQMWDFLLDTFSQEDLYDPLQGKTLLDFAVEEGNIDVIHNLVDVRHYDVSRYYNSGANGRGNALRFVNGNIKVLRVLIGYGIEINVNLVVYLEFISKFSEMTSLTALVYQSRVNPEFLHFVINELDYPLDFLRQSLDELRKRWMSDAIKPLMDRISIEESKLIGSS